MTEQPIYPGAGAPRVVIAEDSPTQAAWLEHVLEGFGCPTTVTRDGEAALLAIRAQPPDLLISDVDMPKMSGFDLCRALKADPKTAGVRVVLATSLTKPDDVLRGLACGADDFLSKPFDADQLESRLFRPRVLEVDPSGAVVLEYCGESHVVRADPAREVGFMLSALEEAERRNRKLEETKQTVQDAMSRILDLEGGLYDVMESSAQAMCVVGSDGLIRFANKAAESLLGVPTTGTERLRFPFPAEDGSREIEVQRPDGSRRTCEMRVSRTIWYGETCSLASFWDITENAMLREELRSLSLTDELTGLRNRRGFRTLAEAQVLVERRRGIQAAGLALLYADLDGMKIINDEFGHDAGDAALVEVAESIATVCRDTDVVARIGGDEFVALLVDCEPDQEKTVVPRLDEALRLVNEHTAAPYRLSVSAGVARMPSGSDWTLDDLMQAADDAMYAVKKERGGRE